METIELFGIHNSGPNVTMITAVNEDERAAS